MFQKEIVTKTNIVRQLCLIDIFNTFKIIYQKIVFIYFELNEFDFDKIKFFKNFIIVIKSKYYWQLTHVILNYFDKTLVRVVKQFVRCVNLQKLIFNIDKKSIYNIVSHIYIIIYEKKNYFAFENWKNFDLFLTRNYKFYWNKIRNACWKSLKRNSKT